MGATDIDFNYYMLAIRLSNETLRWHLYYDVGSKYKQTINYQVSTFTHIYLLALFLI